MKIIVIGLGSIEKRRLRLLSERRDVELFGIDSQESRCEEVKEQFGITCFSSIEEAVETGNIETAVISTSPLSYASKHWNLVLGCFAIKDYSIDEPIQFVLADNI